MTGLLIGVVLATRHLPYKARFWRDGGVELVDYCQSEGVEWPCAVESRDREIDRLRGALDGHGVGMVDKQGVSCLCDADFSFGSGGWVAFNTHLRAALDPV
jgi:hypothetical protein